MKSMYKAAASGNRDAMQGLYNQYRRQLYFTALVLLRDKKLAAGASAAAFRRILRDLPAAGVETEEQYLALKKLGCAIIQGYYFSKPLPAADFEKLLLDKKSSE